MTDGLVSSVLFACNIAELEWTLFRRIYNIEAVGILCRTVT